MEEGEKEKHIHVYDCTQLLRSLLNTASLVSQALTQSNWQLIFVWSSYEKIKVFSAWSRLKPNITLSGDKVQEY